MKFPSNLKYTKEHEWVAVEDGVAMVGVTDHAQEALGDIVYLGDLPEVGDSVDMDDVIGVIESVKATSDIFAPVSGEVVGVNEALDGAPELVNESPYEQGWILKIELSEPAEVDDLLDVEAYQQLLSDEG